MIPEGIQYFASVLRASMDWVTQLFDGSGYLDIYIGFVIMTIAFRRLLSPALTSVGSDRASSRYKSDSREDE